MEKINIKKLKSVLNNLNKIIYDSELEIKYRAIEITENALKTRKAILFPKFFVFNEYVSIIFLRKNWLINFK